MVPPTTPRLRDQHGQPWAWPPLAPSGERTEGFLLPDGGSVASRCWIAFLPGAFTPVCTRELGWMQSLADQLADQAIALRIVSCDPAPVLRAVAEERGISIPMLSDFWPHGAAAQLLGEFDPESGRGRRSSVLIDVDGTVLHRIQAAPGEERTPQSHLNL